ncbi:Ferric enterobactin transport system permease protein fepD [Serratia rubidaea]|uniref:Fe(3+)-siderophore ABC transporter permease n=3 Tax=Serratia rubidaea TaxID=61652 RepID=A0A126VGY7_SERRU|nr:Fe(3+)-siderophore ABC transporter permease [Serratia rubidaea]AML57574.1 Ferric enterobactin transport system permease protein FepD [Serratia rubidaea]MBD8452136.1 Fe(3+)-siderophore ABC transporter permease [Serratia rubidaea]MBH1929353.1 Fe(3+)-siderophore ABC transporter permease [Serratia rubidaea]MCR1000254.1 Fe(3+)-siderophore ABC transporter permease [Serratia rubidaea]MDC6109891.1 Fe(3+)-siderophore ABC transporter permease [Serratia rubidaea]
MFRLTHNCSHAASAHQEALFLGTTRAFRRRLYALLFAILILLLVMALSLALGAQSIPLSTVLQALNGQCSGVDCVIITDARLPRTLIGVLAGIALGLAGALMQILSRNPLADPGILGVNAGAGFAVVLGMSLFGASDIGQYLWFAFGGALCASLLVALVGALGRSTLNPVRLTLAGVALGAVLDGMTTGISLLNPQVFDQLRFWQAGSLDIQNMQVVRTVALPILLGTLIALWLTKALNSLSMGSDLATALGTGIVRTQLLGLLAITLLCGGATAAVGPIAFVGLMMPHIARRLAGSELHWILPWTLVLTPILLLSADLIGRFLVPGELRVSIVTALIGAPVLIALVRQRHMFRRSRG